MDISGNEDKQAEILHKLIEMVTRQTELDYETARTRLAENEWNYMKVIREEMGLDIKPVTAKPSTSLNQEIYRQIRLKMDEAGNSVYSN
tara:strand:- start:7045 stop:7311 length:267 start_codon:yes stop_codon:yes gene_type:complete